MATKGIYNDELYKEFGKNTKNHDAFHYAVKQKIEKDPRLEKPSEKGSLDNEDIQLIKVECYNKVKYISSLIKGKEEISAYEYNSVLGYICLGLTCYLGAKPKLFSEILLDNLDINNKTLTINEYRIKLSDMLVEMLNCYLICRKHVNTTSKKLFVRYNGEVIDKDNQYLNSRVSTILGIGNTTGITKYVVINMIKNRMTQHEITAITYAKKDIYNSCLKLANINEESNSYINKILRKIDKNSE